MKEARLGRKDNKTLITISEIKPDIILLGPNQVFDIITLRESLKDINLENIQVKRLNKFYNKYKLNSSSLIKRKIIELKSIYYKKSGLDVNKLNTSYGKI